MKKRYLRWMIVKKTIHSAIGFSCRRHRFPKLIKALFGGLIVFSPDPVCVFFVKIAGKAYAPFPCGVDIKSLLQSV